MVHIYNRILLSHKKRWNTALCDNMDGPWEYCAKWNKSEKTKNCTTLFMWYTKLILIDTDNSMVVIRGKGGGWVVKGKGGQIYGYRRWFDFGC